MPPEESTEQLLDALQRSWKRSDELFAIVRPDALLERPIPLRNPLVFYVGHLPAFCWNMLGKAVLERGSDHPDLDRLFDFGIDPEDESAVPEEPDWPALDAVHAYRDHVINYHFLLTLMLITRPRRKRRAIMSWRVLGSRWVKRTGASMRFLSFRVRAKPRGSFWR